MCLAIPMKIVKIEGEYALAELGGVKKRIGLQLIERIRAGDYCLIHAGFAIQKIDKKEAKKSLRLLE